MNLRVPYYHLKAALKKRSTWILIGSVLLLIFIFSGISLPDNSNVTVGVVTNGRGASLSIVENIDSMYKFCIYEDEDSLKSAVKDGTLECGFIFAEKFDDRIEKGRLNNLIEYVYSPYTTKGAVIKETVYSAFLKYYSDHILIGSVEDIFGRTKDEDTRRMIEQSLKDKNAYYMGSNDIFTVDFNNEFK